MARDFSGTDQYLDLASVPISGVPFTLAAWYRYDTAIADEAEHSILSLTDADAFNEWTIEIGRTGGVDYAIAMVNENNTNLGFALSTTPPTINTWQHIAGIYTNNSSRTVYLNAANNATETTTATPTGVSNVNIGATLSNSVVTKDFNGAIAECAIWNTNLTAAEITILSKGYSPLFVRPGNLVFYSPLVREMTNFKGGALTNNSSSVFDHPRIIYPANYQIAPFATAAATQFYTSRMLLTGVGM